MRQHDPRFTVGQLDQAAHREHADRLNELLEQRLVERAAAPLVHLHQRFLRRHGFRVRPVGDQRREAVGDRGHASVDRDVLALEPLRISGAVDALVVLHDALLDDAVERHALAQRLDAELHVAPDDGVLGGREHARLLEQRARQADLADVCEHPDLPEADQLVAWEAHVASERDQVDPDLQAVMVSAPVLVAQARDPQHRVGRLDHALDEPLGDLVDVSQVRAGVVAQVVHQGAQGLRAA